MRRLYENLEDMDLIDLINSRHLLLNEVRVDLWGRISDISVSNSEFYIMSKIYQKKPTISSISKQVHFTRQATHKFIRKLEEKGLIEVQQANLRDKCVLLTKVGEEYYGKYVALKNEIESRVAEQIGLANLKKLKDLLKMEWGL